MSFINYYLLLLSIFYLGVKAKKTFKGPEKGKDYPEISCGKPNPKKEKDCTKYGTDSGMLCCWVAKVKTDTQGECTLLSQKTAEDNTYNFKGSKVFDDKYWSCGNKSFHLKADIIFVLILIILTLLY